MKSSYSLSSAISYFIFYIPHRTLADNTSNPYLLYLREGEMAELMYTPQNLPNDMIGLATPDGQNLLNESIQNKLLVERCRDQVNRTYCGVASAAAVLNGINVASRVKYMLHLQEQQDNNESGSDDFFENLENSGDQLITEDDVVRVSHVQDYLAANTNLSVDGLTLQQLKNLVSVLGFGVETYYACGGGDGSITKAIIDKVVGKKQRTLSTCDEFKRIAVNLIQRPVSGLIVNYSMSQLGYDFLCGHFSPLAAYHETSDQFLVLDVWPDTPPAWVKSDLLFKAMSTVDNESGMPRGLLRIHELLI